MDFLDRYRKRVKHSNPDTVQDDFIKLALNRIHIQKVISGETEEKGEKLDAVLIFRDKEGPDTALLYTYRDDELKVGDFIYKQGAATDTDSYFIITEEIKRVDGSSSIRVFRVYEANVYLKLENINKPAYMNTSIKEIALRQTNAAIQVERKNATVVVPSEYNIKLGEILRVSNILTSIESDGDWRVDGKDDMTSPYMSYVYVSQVLKADTPEYVKPPKYNLGEVIVLETSQGYIESNNKINIIKRTEKEITIKLPSYITTLEIKVKDKDGNTITKIIKVGVPDE